MTTHTPLARSALAPYRWVAALAVAGCASTGAAPLSLRIDDPGGTVEAPLGVPGVRARPWVVGEAALDCALAQPPDHEVSAVELLLTLDGDGLRVELAETRGSRDEAVRRCVQASLGGVVLEPSDETARRPAPLLIDVGPRPGR